jgi:hypothetical protein
LPSNSLDRPRNRRNLWFINYLKAISSVLAMAGVVARVVIKVKIDITNGFGIWLF